MKEAKKICKNCGKCCQETEMMISKEDIRLIENKVLNVSKEDFAELNDEGIYQLINKENHCIFLDMTSKLCRIYEYRPKGCRFYPIIYDYENETCIYDQECPRVSLFHVEPDNFKNICNSIKQFLRTELKLDIS